MSYKPNRAVAHVEYGREAITKIAMTGRITRNDASEAVSSSPSRT